MELAVLVPAVEFLAVKVIGGAMLLAEGEPVAGSGALKDALFEEGAERRDAGARVRS